MDFWRVWNESSRATHGVNRYGDHTNMWVVGLVALAGLAVGLFFLARMLLQKPKRKQFARAADAPADKK